jgi:hypothetical protein
METTTRISVESKLGDLDKVIEEYERHTNISCIKNDGTDVDKYLTMSRDEFSKMDPEDLGQAAWVLSRYALYVQKEHNLHFTRKSWAEENVKLVIAKETIQQRGTSYEERRLLAIKDNDVAMKLERIRVEAQNRTNMLYNLATRIEFVVKVIQDQKFIKRRQ